MSETRKLVTIYADGGAEPNPGPGGYGIILIFGTHRRARTESPGLIKYLCPLPQFPTIFRGFT